MNEAQSPHRCAVALRFLLSCEAVLFSPQTIDLYPKPFLTLANRTLLYNQMIRPRRRRVCWRRLGARDRRVRGNLIVDCHVVLGRKRRLKRYVDFHGVHEHRHVNAGELVCSFGLSIEMQYGEQL